MPVRGHLTDEVIKRAQVISTDIREGNGRWPIVEWTDQMYVDLHEGWKQGLTVAQLAGYMKRMYPTWQGCLNSNALIGKIHRARLNSKYAGWFERRQSPIREPWGSRHTKPPPKVEAPQPKPIRKIGDNVNPLGAKVGSWRKKGRVGHVHMKLSGAPVAAPVEAVKHAAAQAKRDERSFAPTEHEPKTLFELKDDQCHWPVVVEGREMMYCGKPVSGPRKSYCAEHGSRS